MPILAKAALVLAVMQPAATYVESSAANWIEAQNISLTPLEAGVAELDLSGSTTLGSNLKQLYGKQVKLGFDIALAGSGTAGTAPYWDVLERLCGNSSALIPANATAVPPVTAHALYKPTATFEQGSMVCYIGSNKHAMLNVKGSAKLTIARNGYLMRRYEFVGVYMTPSAVAAPAVDITPRVTPLILQPNNTTLNLHGISNLCLHSLEINDGNEVKYMDFLNCTANTSITARAYSGSIEFIAETLTATTNWWKKAEDASLGALTFSLGSAAGNKLSITCPSVQLLQPNYGEVDGLRTVKCNLNILQATAGDFQLSAH